MSPKMEINSHQAYVNHLILQPDKEVHDKYIEISDPQPVKHSFFNVYGKNIALAIVTHTLWSSLSVFTRYLLVKAPITMDSLVLLSTTKLVSFICIFLFGDYEYSFKLPENSEEEIEETENSSLEDHKEEFEEEDKGKEKEEIENSDNSLRRKIFIGFLFAILTTARAALGVECLRYTTAKNTALIQSLSPLIVPVADALILKTKMPPNLWPTVIMSVLGCMIVVFAQKKKYHTFTESDTIGCLMKFGSVLVTAFTRIIMKSSNDLLTRNELLQYANIGTIVIPLVYTLATDATVWLYFLDLPDLPIKAIISWSAIGILVYFLGASMQVDLVRALSPGLYSSFEAIRVLGAVFLSTIWLHEPVNNWLEWLGILLTVGVITKYFKDLLKKDNDKEICKNEIKKSSDQKKYWDEYGCYVNFIL